MNRFLILVCVAVAIVAPRDALTDPAKKTKVATQADIDRLDKKIADHQRMLDKLVRLQQQHLQALIALLPDPGAATVTQPQPPVDDPKPEPKADPKLEANPEAKLEKAIARAEAKAPQPAAKAVEPKRIPRGVGTVVGKVKGGGGDAFVYIEDIVAPASGTAVMKQEGKQFVPRVMAVQKGFRVEFPNRDAVFHNVFSVTPDSSFDLGSYKQGETKGVAMTKPGVVSVYCNMHPQMSGYILVTPSNHYARAGADGFYSLPNVPVGKHRLVAWAPNAKPVVSEIEVADSEVVTVELEVRRGAARPHLNKDGMPYGSYKD